MTELSEAELDGLVGRAVVDAADDDEQMTALYTSIQDNLSLPFATTVLGVEVSVTALDLTASGVVAICVRGEHRQAIPVLDLPMPVPPPAGAEWIAAFRHWVGA